jgi:hypothetical protein
MRVYELIAHHSIPSPPPLVTSFRPFAKVPLAGEGGLTDAPTAAHTPGREDIVPFSPQPPEHACPS